MNAQTAKITPGEWVVHKPISGGIFVVTEMPVVSVCFYYADAAEANARLIAEAGTVANETGLTPRQLADQRAELLAEMVRYLPIIERAESDHGVWEKLTNGMGIATANGYRAAIAKAVTA